MSQPNPKRLVVEDTDLQGVVIGLMMHYVEWGKTEEEWPVFVRGKKGKSNVFKPKELKVEMKASGVKRIGIVVDANSDLKATWDQVSQFCKQLGGNPPRDCPKEGLIVPIADQIFGAWIMPNNQMEGMVENLCHGLVPASAEELWKFALNCAETAKNEKNAPFSPDHLAKAHIHTWLAWQKNPGERLGVAITGGTLEHVSDDAKAFVKWFMTLYELVAKAEN